MARERRRQGRLVVNESGRMYWSNGADVQSMEVGVKDVSEDGVQVLAQHPIPLGEVVRLAGAACEFFGTVRHCRPQGDYWLLGIQLTGSAYSKLAAEARD